MAAISARRLSSPTFRLYPPLTCTRAALASMHEVILAGRCAIVARENQRRRAAQLALARGPRGERQMRIDVHAHYFPDEYIDALTRLGHKGARPAVVRAPGQHVTLAERADLLKEHQVDVQVLSVASPGPYLRTEADAVEAARLGNDIYADACRGYDGRFAAFGTVPLPHTYAAIAEASRCLDELGFKGITVGCSVAGQQLDEEAFEPFFAELDRRGAVLFLHPQGVGGGPGSQDFGLNWMVGAPFEDTIVALRLVFSGLTSRFPNMRVIVPHLGGTLPFLMQRLDD